MHLKCASFHFVHTENAISTSNVKHHEATATQRPIYWESLRWIPSLLLYVRTQILRLWLGESVGAALSVVDFSTQPEPLWAPGAEQRGWQRPRHQPCLYKGLKGDKAPEALGSLHQRILHNKVHNTQYPHLSCPLFMMPVRGAGQIYRH